MPASNRTLGVASFSDCGESPALMYTATTVTQVFFIATVPSFVTQLTYRMRVGSTSGTAVFYRVPSGTAVGSGVAISGTVDLSATPAADTTFNIPLLSTPVGNQPGVLLNPGDSIGIVIAGTMTNGVGILQAFVEPAA
jgi:hypothetical protein